MARVRYRGSYSGVGEMLVSPGMQAAMLRVAERIKDRAEATAPVGDPETDPHAGRYKAAFRVESGVRRRRTSRAYGRVINDVPEAAEVEWGTTEQEAHHTILNALTAARE